MIMGLRTVYALQKYVHIKISGPNFNKNTQLRICTQSRTQYKQLRTMFIHLLHKVGVGTSQDGTSISSNQCMSEATIYFIVKGLGIN